MLSLKEKANTLVVVHFAPLGIAVGLANPPHPNPQDENKTPGKGGGGEYTTLALIQE